MKRIPDDLASLTPRPTIAEHEAALRMGYRRVPSAFGDLDEHFDAWFVSDGRFSFADVMLWALDFTGPADALISTWTIGPADARAILTMLADGRLEDVRFLIDHSFAPRIADFAGTLEDEFGPDRFRSLDNHAKGAALKGRDHDAAFLTSANLNQNPRAEVWAITGQPDRARGWREAMEQLWSAASPGTGRTTGAGIELERIAKTKSLPLAEHLRRASDDARAVVRKPVHRNALKPAPTTAAMPKQRRQSRIDHTPPPIPQGPIQPQIREITPNST